jgi:uncharacterized protein HemX
MTKVTKNKIDNSQTDFTEKQYESPIFSENNIKEPPKTKWRKIRRGAKLAFVVVFLVAMGLSYKFYQELRVYKNPELQAAQQQQEAKQLIQKVGKLIILPSEETPIVATVNDAKTLATQQAFYKEAVNGDKLLIYTVSQKAILYSPSRNMIVNVGPFVSTSQNETPKNP